MRASKPNHSLTPEEGSPAEIINPNGTAPVCLVCEHASANIPDALGDLRLAQEHRYSHAVWDVGAEMLARDLSARLDAPLIVATVSRLVYDLNRPPEAADAMPERSGEISVPGNRALSETHRAARTAEIYEPFHSTVSDVLDGFDAPPVFVTIHSFTPIWDGKRRTTELGLLHDADDRLATAMLDHAAGSLATRLNDPYSANDGVTHTLKRHAISRGLRNVMIEVRNDLLGSKADVTRIAARLEIMLTTALQQLDRETTRA